MKLPLLCMVMLAISSSSRVQKEEGVLSKPIISYKIIKSFPKSRLVHIFCHSVQGPSIINYILMETSNIIVSKKIMNNGLPARFPILATFKSRPDLFNYYCRASTALGQTASSDILKLFWELWALKQLQKMRPFIPVSQRNLCSYSMRGEVMKSMKFNEILCKGLVPVSQPQANFTLRSTGSGQMVVVLCLASEGSPPITYILFRKDGHILMEETPYPGRPANFSFPVNKLSAWYSCQAKNIGSTQFSGFTLVPPGELPLAPTFVLAVSLTSMMAATFIILYQNTMKR